MDSVENAVKYCLEVEKSIPLENVLNLDEIIADIKNSLLELKNVPNRLENPVIYHLDVGT